MKICLVCSSGGHFLQLHSLKDLWKSGERVWVTFPGRDTEFFLNDEKVCWAYHPTNRSIKNLLKNLFLAAKVLRKEKPDVVISTGAGISVPFIYMGRILGIKTIYIESLTRIRSLSLSGRLVYPVVHRFVVQWPALTERYKKAVFKGQVL